MRFLLIMFLFIGFSGCTRYRIAVRASYYCGPSCEKNIAMDKSKCEPERCPSLCAGTLVGLEAAEYLPECTETCTEVAKKDRRKRCSRACEAGVRRAIWLAGFDK